MNQKILITDLNSTLIEPIALYIGMASFESRCISLLKEICEKNICNTFHIFKNAETSDQAESNLTVMLSLIKSKVITTVISLDEPTLAANSFTKIIEYTRTLKAGSIFIDITTFTHEQLLILFRILEQIKLKRNIIFGYTGADEYSTNTTLEDIWLSKGVSQIRSVLGFPGNLLPSKKLHLILLAGFEHERAKTVIEQFEPNVLSIGIGKRDQSMSDKHHETNARFFQEIKKFVELTISTATNVNTFEFSCVDPLETKNIVLNQASLYQNFNTVICPMNTKLSTLGVAFAATENETLQICYSRAIAYNESGYSCPSNRITLFNIQFE
jgi:hypothetical protein